MNILISYNWLKEYLKTDLSPQDFASRVSLSGPSIERIYQKCGDWEKIVVGKIVNITKHPNADKLHLVETDIGRKKVQIVCGGSNLQGGMKVAVALPGAKVRWHGDDELVELKESEIRGEKSFGMICSGEEIGLGKLFPAKEEKEILDLGDLDAKPGTDLNKALILDDTIFDIEITTNRPDAMSIVGIAREAGTILKVPFTMPEVRKIKEKNDGSALKIKNEESDLCYRYQAVVIEGVKIKESPLWLKKKLASAGTRSINNIVDITNLVLWEMGQPLHAFDYEKLEGKKIVIRKAKMGENIIALDGEKYKLKNSHLVIADAKNPVAIAGVMGGAESGVSEATTTIVLEAATFNSVSVRKTSRELNLRSESSALFEKGLSTEATTLALLRAANLIMELAGGIVKSKIFNESSKLYKQKEVSVKVERVNNVLGINLEDSEMIDILNRLGFDARLLSGEIVARVPYWREGDIMIAEDLIEEIARIYGYHRLPSILPEGKLPDMKESRDFIWQKDLRNFAVSAGFSETYSYSMISKKMFKDFHFGSGLMIGLLNPLSEDLEYMRPSLLPSLLETVSINENNFGEAKIFELSRVYHKVKSEELPEENLRYSGIVYGKENNGNLFYNIKGFVEELFSRYDLHNYELKSADNKNYHPSRSLSIYIGKEYLGDFGEIHPALLARFGIKSRVAFFDFDFAKLIINFKEHKTYSPLSPYPKVVRDISFVVDKKQEFGAIKELIIGIDELVRDAELFDVYEGKGMPDGKKSMALHITFRSARKTLEIKEVDVIWEKIAQKLKKDLKADIRS